MSISKHLSSVTLFPLCDARSVLIDALRDTSDAPATRGDALVFAWRLELPEGMNVSHAANAVLLTALSVPRSGWSRRQLLIIRELMVLAGREEALPEGSTTAPAPTDSIRERRASAMKNEVVKKRAKGKTAQRSNETQKPVPKQEKEWWRLVGRDNP